MVHRRLVHQEQGCSQGNSILMIAMVATRKYGRQDGLSTSSAVGVYMLPCLSSAWWEMDPQNAFAIFWGSFGITSTVYLAAPILCLSSSFCASLPIHWKSVTAEFLALHESNPLCEESLLNAMKFTLVAAGCPGSDKSCQSVFQSIEGVYAWKSMNSCLLMR